jgi:hypothetical protein
VTIIRPTPAALFAAAVLCALVGSAPRAAADGQNPRDLLHGTQTALQIATSDSAPGVAARHLVLRCSPARGTVFTPATACARLLRMTHPFAPVPPQAVCGMVALEGRAVITGLLRGRPVHATLTRVDTCQTARWNRLRFLLVPA